MDYAREKLEREQLEVCLNSTPPPLLIFIGVSKGVLAMQIAEALENRRWGPMGRRHVEELSRWS
jgi:hypothetical protein